MHLSPCTFHRELARAKFVAVQGKLAGLSIAFIGRTGRLAPIPLKVDHYLAVMGLGRLHTEVHTRFEI
jgi:hypothetical protein